MKYLSMFILSSIILLAIIPFSFAWTKDTQEYMANEVCKQFPDCNGHYNELVKKYSMYPDKYYVYPMTYKNHVNYYMGWNCTKGNWVCPDFYDQSALKATAELLNASYKLQGKDKWKLIAIAGHYYFESQEFWHKVMNEDYFECHKRMEDLFDKNFRENKTAFQVCTCGICQNSSELYILKNNLVNFIRIKSYPKGYRMDNASLANTLYRVSGDWQAAFNHIVTELNPGVPRVINVISKKIENSTSN